MNYDKDVDLDVDDLTLEKQLDVLSESLTGTYYLNAPKLAGLWISH